MTTYNIGFLNSKKQQDETQLDIEEYKNIEDEFVDLINSILELREELDIKEITYIEAVEEDEE